MVSSSFAPLAYDYEGRWTAPAGGGPLARDSVFEITILQATCPGCTPMPGVATVKPKDTASIRTRAGSSPRASAPSPPLGGDYGKVVGPTIVAFVADDFDNGDAAYGSLDTLTVVFDLATDRGGLGDDAGATAAAVAMLSFSTDLGGDTVGSGRTTRPWWSRSAPRPRRARATSSSARRPSRRAP